MPWLGGVQPVKNEVQATGVTMGSEDRSVPVADRLQSEARFGIRPRWNPAVRTAIVPPSRPRNKTRDADAGMDGCLADAGSSRPRSIGGRQPSAAARGPRAKRGPDTGWAESYSVRPPGSIPSFWSSDPEGAADSGDDTDSWWGR